MVKEMRRAERRWRSHCKFLRRLKQDWNQHGWNWGPRWYERSYQLTPEAACSIWAGTDLCECFYDKKAQARFKDTPNTCNCWTCRNPRRVFAGKNSSALTFAERRAFLDDREDWHKRRWRRGWRSLKVQCRHCGITIGSRSVSLHSGDGRGPGELCRACEEAVSKVNFYWFNGKYMEFQKPA